MSGDNSARVYGDPKDAENTHALFIIDGERGPYLQFDSERGIAGMVRDAQEAGLAVVVLKKDDLFPYGVRIKTAADKKVRANVVRVTDTGTHATVKCAYCGQHFHARMADVNRGWAVYCSKHCKACAQSLRQARKNEKYEQRRQRGVLRTHPLSTEGIGQDGTGHELPYEADLEEDAERDHLEALQAMAGV